MWRLKNSSFVSTSRGAVVNTFDDWSFRTIGFYANYRSISSVLGVFKTSIF